METRRNQLTVLAVLLTGARKQLTTSTVAAPFDADCRQQRKDALESLDNIAAELRGLARPDPAGPHSGVGS